MATSIFLPNKIHVGFQNREGTYTGKLAYVVYEDERGTLRKQASWDTWRDKKIPAIVADNVPTNGFVLNKKVGGYKSNYYDMRQSYVRVYDPRGFEFEITIPNLVYILENVSCIKGKGLDGDFVYGWSGSELLLIPTDAPDYAEMQANSATILSKSKVKISELVLGATYRSRGGIDHIYLGRFVEYNKYNNTSLGRKFFFCVPTPASKYSPGNAIVTMSSPSSLISRVGTEIAPNYSELMEILEKDSSYSPIDPSKDVFVPYTLEEFKKLCPADSYRHNYVFGANKVFYSIMYRPANSYSYRVSYGIKPGWILVPQHREYTYNAGQLYESIEDLFTALKPQHKDTYLANGKFYRREH